MADIDFYLDPTCPFCWMTSTWVRQVQSQKRYDVQWRFISLRMVNAGVDYAEQFPPEYEAGHTAGLRLLRVAAATREDHGNEAVGRLYAEIGARTFEGPEMGRHTDVDPRGTAEFVRPLLAAVGLPESLAEALDDDTRDAVVREETDRALEYTGKDVGTPIIHFQPPEGVSFFGPVISRAPRDDEAVELWERVVALAGFPGFAELKRSLRELPQLSGLGVESGDVGAEEDWHGGSRRLKK